MTIETLVDGLQFPECPRVAGGAVWFVDSNTVRRFEPGGELSTVVTLPTPVLLGLVVETDRIVVGAALERRLYEVPHGGNPRVLVDLSEHFSAPTNEFLRAANGGWYVGTMGFNPVAGEDPVAAAPAWVDANGVPTPTGSPLTFANGMVLAPDGNTVLVAETFASRISRLPIQRQGGLGPAELVADLSSIGGRPDGIAVTPDGDVWYADVDKGEVVLLQAGKVVKRIGTGYAHATSCAFDDGDLWVTVTQRMPEGRPFDIPPGALLRIEP